MRRDGAERTLELTVRREREVDARLEYPGKDGARDEGEVLKIVRFDDIHDSPPEMRPLKLDEMRERQGRRLEGFGHGQPGFVRGDAFTALEALRDSAVAVEAVDVVRVAYDRPEYVLQRWRCERGVGEPYARFCRRSHKLARDFLIAYPDSGDGSVLYVLFTTDSGGVSRAA